MERTPVDSEMTVVSARGLKDVGQFSKMDVYVAVSMSGDPRTELKTPVDQDCGSSPSWNYPVKFSIDKAAIQMNHLCLSFKLRHERSLIRDKDVGEGHVPIKELLDNVGAAKCRVLAEYPVRKPSGKMQRKFKFAYKFVEVYESEKTRATSVYPPLVKAEPYPPQMEAVVYPPPVVQAS